MWHTTLIFFKIQCVAGSGERRENGLFFLMLSQFLFCYVYHNRHTATLLGSLDCVRMVYILAAKVQPKTLRFFEMPMALSLSSGSFPSNLNISATSSFWIHSGKFRNPTNCEKFNADGSLMGRTNLDKSVW